MRLIRFTCAWNGEWKKAFNLIGLNWARSCFPYVYVQCTCVDIVTEQHHVSSTQNSLSWFDFNYHCYMLLSVTIADKCSGSSLCLWVTDACLISIPDSLSIDFPLHIYAKDNVRWSGGCWKFPIKKNMSADRKYVEEKKVINYHLFRLYHFDLVCPAYRLDHLSLGFHLHQHVLHTHFFSQRD